MKRESEARKAIDRRGIRFNGPELSLWTGESDQIQTLKQIQEVMQLLEKSEDNHFSEGERNSCGYCKLKVSQFGRELLKLINEDLASLAKNYPIHVFNPYISVFLRLIAPRWLLIRTNAKLLLEEEELKRLVFILNRRFHWIRAIFRSAKFREATRVHKNGVQQNLHSCLNYLIAHFKVHSRLLILRIDLHFLIEHIRSITAEDNNKGLDKFLRALREGRIVKGVVGYISVSEYGYQRGYHQHLLVALNSNVHQRDIHLSQVIGEYWERCTDNKGSYFNCNRIKEHYFHCGIGMVHISETEKLKGLRDALVYMLKGDYYIKFMAEGMRTLRKGNMPKEKTKRGAPRHNPVDTLNMERILKSRN